MRNLIFPLLIMMLFLINATPAWSEESSAGQNNSKFWATYAKLKASKEWKSLKKATMISRQSAGAKAPLTDKEKTFDSGLKKLQAHGKTSANKTQSAEAQQEEKEIIEFLSHEPIPPFKRSVSDKKPQDDDMAWLMKEALSQSPKFKQKLKEMKEKEDNENLKLWMELDKLPPLAPESKEGYNKALLEISKIRMERPNTPGLDEAWAYIKGMKDADAIKSGRKLPDSPSPKAEMILDALEIGNGDWKTSIYYLQGMKEVAPNNTHVIEALKYTREIQTYEQSKKEKKQTGAINRNVVDASINNDAKTAKFLTGVNSSYIKDAKGAISTVINMRTSPQVRTKAQKLIPAKQQNSVRTMVESIPPGRYFSDVHSTSQGARGSAPQGYNPPTSPSGGCPSRR